MKGTQTILPKTEISTTYDGNGNLITEVKEDYDNNKITITFPEYYLTGSTQKPTQKPDLPQGEYKIEIYQTYTASTPLIKQPINLIQMPFNLTFYHHDHLGTTRYITNENGGILHTTDTLAYGEELTAPYENDKDEVLNTITFTGHEKDYETDFTYMLARYYSQGYGRFLSPDPGYDYDQLDPMSWNLYSYVRGNPITHLDPTGKWDEKKRAEVRKKLKELKLRDKHYYMQLIHKLKTIANFIDKYGDKNMAMGFVKGLDETGLIAAFEDENGNINLGSHQGWQGSYLWQEAMKYNTSQSMHLHLQTMDKLSEGTGYLSLVPIVGPAFGVFSGMFGLSGSINSKTNEDPNKGLKTAEYIISMGMCFLPGPGDKAVDLWWSESKYASEFDATVNALGKQATRDKINAATSWVGQKAIDAKLKEGNNN